MGAVVVLLTALLFHGALSSEDEGIFPCGLSDSETRILANGSRMWKVDDGSLAIHDMQDIVNCTEAGDIISLQTTKTIQPRSRIVIPWQLTIEASGYGSKNTAAADLKVTMTCPPAEGLFLLKSADLVLKNLIVSGCDLGEQDDVAGIIETDACQPDFQTSNEWMLHHIDFTRNKNLGGALLSVHDPSCFRVTMRDVRFRSNQFSKQSKLSSLNDIGKVKLIGNDLSTDHDNETCLFYLPPESNNTIRSLMASDNNCTLFRIDRGSVDMRNSTLSRNLYTMEGIISATASNVSISDSLFYSNRYEEPDPPWVWFPEGRGYVISLDTTILSGGAVFVLSSKSIELSRCVFESNVATYHYGHAMGGGAVLISDTEGASHTNNSIRILGCSFLKNSVSGDGFGSVPGVYLHQLKQSQILISSSIFEENIGTFFKGGALSLYFCVGWTLEINSSKFKSNKAVDGGAITLMSESEATGSFSCLHSEFKWNKAENYGAAIYGTRIEEFELGNCTFEGNQATGTGGGIALRYCESNSIKDSIFDGNRAEIGAAAAFFTSYAVLDDTSFVRNEAVSGGGIYASGKSLRINDCRFESNVAEVYGGGIHVTQRQGDVISLAGSTVLLNNTARIGGGAFIGTLRSRIRPVVSIRSPVLFVDNHAEHAGGGVFVDVINRYQGWSLNCSRDPRIVVPFSVDKGLNAVDVECQNLKNNSVGEGGYGPDIATPAVSFFLTVFDVEKRDFAVWDTAVVSEHKSGDRLPVLQVTLFDHFTQGPALTKPTTLVYTSLREAQLLDYFAFAKATLESFYPPDPDGLIPNPFVTDVSSGMGNISLGAPFQIPGTYGLILWVGEDKAHNITVEVTLRTCVINEESIRNNTQCNVCDLNHYNVKPENGECQPCPEDCVCAEWGIAPKKNHWIPDPCSAHVMECLSDRACKYDGREENLTSFFQEYEASCDPNSSTKADFNSRQCGEGHEGLLCGSCSDEYGQNDLTCKKCMSRWLVILGMLGVVVYTSLAFSVAIAGNVAITEASQAALLDASRWRLSGPFVRSPREITIPDKEEASAPLINLRSEGSVAARILANAHDLAKSKVTECVKLFLNFAQVNSIATTINTGWTNLLRETLSGFNVAGAMSVEKMISLDCLFPTLDARSIVRESISLLLPLVVLAIWIVYWFITIRKGPAFLGRRLVLSTVVIFYISYIGYVDHLSGALNCISIPYDVSNGYEISQSYWTEDTSVVCFEGSHLIFVVLLVVPMILTVLLMFPIGSAVYLYLKRQNGELNSLAVMEKFGFMYKAYTKECVFWDCLILLRKAVLALVIVFGASLGSNMQGLICLCVLIFSLYLQTKYMPYNEDFHAFNSIEIFSQLVCIFTFLSGLFLNDEKISEEGRTIVTSVAIACMASFVIYFLYNLSQMIFAFCRISLEQDEQPFAEEDSGLKITAQWIRYRYTRATNQLNRTVH